MEIFFLFFNTGEKPCVYFVGIIDILTNYGAMKRAAHAAKTVKHGVRCYSKVYYCNCLCGVLCHAFFTQSHLHVCSGALMCVDVDIGLIHQAGADISTVKPEQYARRFLDFLTKSIQ